jgi:hypothetical protein
MNRREMLYFVSVGVIRFLAFLRGAVLSILVWAILLLFREFEPAFAFYVTLVIVLGLCIGGLIGLFLVGKESHEKEEPGPPA